MFSRRYGLFAWLLVAAGFLSLSASCFQQTTVLGKHFYYYSLEDRVALLRSMKKAILVRYALIDVKKRRLGIDIDDIFAQAISTEQEFGDVNTTFSQSVSNLRFLDRVQRSIALFQDTHLQSYPVLPLPTIYLGFDVREVEGKFVLTRISERIQRLADINEWSLRVGDELLAIGDETVHQQRDELIPYISGSSPHYRRAQAAAALTERTFSYPAAAAVRVIFRLRESGQIKKLRLRWKYTYEEFRVDASYYLESQNFNYRPRDLSLPSTPSKNPFRGMKYTEEWYGYSEPDKLVLRTGWLNSGKSSVGVIQLYSFLERQVVKKASLSTGVEWDEPIISFLLKLKRRHRPLILDLRYNEGGHVEFPIRLMSLLAEDGKLYPSYTESFRITHGIRQIWQRVSPQDNLYNSEAQAARQVQKAIKNHDAHTAIWSKTADLKSADEVAGFNEPMVTLMSGMCVSACDIMALLLEKSGRSEMLGEAANGTGAGYFSWEPYQDTKWTDLYQIVSLDIPNMLFGHGMAVGERENTRENAFYEYNRENLPVMPKYHYRDSLDDIIAGWQGWRDVAVQIIENNREIQSSVSISKK